jgi:hypothetical protein
VTSSLSAYQSPAFPNKARHFSLERSLQTFFERNLDGLLTAG